MNHNKELKHHSFTCANYCVYIVADLEPAGVAGCCELFEVSVEIPDWRIDVY